MNDSVMCPVSCVRSACPEPDWLEKHETFVLTVAATLSAALGVMFSFFLKSRCTKIKCFGFACDRQPVDLDTNNLEIITHTSNSSNSSPPPAAALD